MWICPDCGRKFARNKQSHSCESYSLEDLLRGKNPAMVELFQQLMNRVNQFDEVELHPTKWGITVRHLSTFLSVMVEKDHLTLVFVSREPVEEFPVYQNYHYSANRWHNAVKIESEEEIDDQLINWLKAAWEVTG